MLKGKVCCFFGHHDTSENIRNLLSEQVETLIKSGTEIFYMGNHGHFDFMALGVLREMKGKYPQISYTVVLSRMPDRPVDEYSYFSPEESLFPDGLEKVPRRFGILWRNDWMLKQSDIVICYVTHYFGGAGKMLEKAVKQEKTIINLAEKQKALG